MGPTEPRGCERWLLKSRNTDVVGQYQRQWASGRAVLLGLILPFTIAIVALAAVTGGIWRLVSLWNGTGPGAFRFLFAAFLAWLVSKALRTVWLVTSTDSYLFYMATTASWTVPFDDLISVAT